jgi:carboxylesterase type B
LIDVNRRVVSQPEFRREAEGFLERVGLQEGPIAHDDLILPLSGRPIRVRALAWLEAHGEAFGGDGRVAAGGQSSGANLVAAACLMARDQGRPRVTRQVLCYPWLDLGTGAADGVPRQRPLRAPAGADPRRRPGPPP